MKQGKILPILLFLSALTFSSVLANDGGVRPQPSHELSYQMWKAAWRAAADQRFFLSGGPVDGWSAAKEGQTGAPLALPFAPRNYFFEIDGGSPFWTDPDDVFPVLPRVAPAPLPDTVPLTDRVGDYLRDSSTNPFYLRDPDFIDKKIEYDPATNGYFVTEKIGDDYYRVPTQLTYSEYLKYKAEKQEKDYFEKLAGINRRKGAAKVDPFSKIDFSNTNNGKLKMLVNSLGVNGKLDPSKFNPKAISDKMVSWVFGSDPPVVDIRPQGQIDLTLGYDYRRYDNPAIPIQGRVTGGLLFDMNINVNVTGKIGEKLNLNTAFNNRATFDFDNIMKLNYNGSQFSEDDIVKSIEAGNVSLPLRGQLIQGSQNLFGIKTELQFGYLRLTAVAAQQKSQRKSLNLQGGAQTQTFAFQADQYDENRHFFLSHLNRNSFEPALANLPIINSFFVMDSIQVWVSNDRNDPEREVRQIIALSDLGEGDRFNNPAAVQPTSGYNDRGFVINNGHPPTAIDHLPDNNANNLYSRLKNDPNIRRVQQVSSRLESSQFGLVSGIDYVKKTARLLRPTEYSYNPQLGTLSVGNLDRSQLLAVAFAYHYNGHGPEYKGKKGSYKVGEFLSDVDQYTSRDTAGQVIFVKMLKSPQQATDVTSPNGTTTELPLWDLMMKNVYAVNAYVNNPQDFKLDIYYQDATSQNKAEKRFLPEDKLRDHPLLEIFNLDRLNSQGDLGPDGQFDFVPGITINPRNGRIMFPLLEPFGRSLAARITNLTGDSTLGEKYTFPELYTTTQFKALEHIEKDRFVIRGTVKSSVTSEISLGTIGLRPGSLRVTAGGRPLTEGVDYEVNYGIGTLRVINPAYLGPDLPVNISFEDNALFSFQTKTLLGLRADYKINKNFNVGATILNLFEQPYVRKVSYGEDPINNKIYGVDMNFSEDAPWLTKLVDKIPGIQTKEPSRVTFIGEAAYLQPGHSSAIDIAGDNTGAVYLDDFEGSTSPYSLMSGGSQIWQLASIPQHHSDYPEGVSPNIESLQAGANRASLSWYFIDTYLLQDPAANANDNYSATISPQEIFPNRSQLSPLDSYLRTFDLSYIPRDRGQYNFELPHGTPFSKGISANGELRNPETRWGGIMRGLTVTDFETANIEYIDFWMLDPFLNDKDDRANRGKLIFQLGDISEDILHDGRKAYENGLPAPTDSTTKVDRTIWGRVPRSEQAITNAFANDTATQRSQDVGLDGVDDNGERSQFSAYLSTMQSYMLPNAYAQLSADPSNDNFTYYTNYPSGTSIYERYKKYNKTEGNSKANNTTDVQSSTNLADTEDVNHDNSFDENEAYYEYEVPLVPDLPTGIQNNRYFVEKEIPVASTFNGNPNGRVWYHYRVPISDYTSVHGQIEGFRNIRFIRMIVKGFTNDTTHIRFGQLNLVRNSWRRYLRDQTVPGYSIDKADNNTTFEVGGVNIEENSQKMPFHYVIPPGIVQDQAVSSYTTNALQNEQSLQLKVCNLQAGGAKSVFKLFNTDLRFYKGLKMFVHAESTGGERIDSNKTSVFMRIGSDFENNYYEVEIPLKLSDLVRAGNPSPQGATASEQYRNEVWQAGNSFDLKLDIFAGVKEERNALNIPLSLVYNWSQNKRIKIVGNPNLGLVKGVMVGIYNKDAVPHCLELWIDELRMVGLDEQGGLAALARADFKLADLGAVTVSGKYTGIGYGGLEQKVQARSLNDVLQYDLQGNFELGKFLPARSGVHIPFYAQYSNSTSTPKYDPYDLDLKLSDKLNNSAVASRDSIHEAAQTQTVIKGYSLINVRKDRTNTQKAPKPWDIENFSASYAYTQTLKHDPIIEHDKRDAYKGGLDYTYQRQPTYITPFKRLFKKDKYVKLLTEFNFNPIPTSFAFNTILDRQYSETQYRFAGDDPGAGLYYQKRFTWDRNYSLQWDLTKSLKINRFDIRTTSIIDEPLSGPSNTDTILKSLKSLGRMKRYDQVLDASYVLPFKLIPYLDWVNVKASYAGDYHYEAAPLEFGIDEVTLEPSSIGNTIRNGQNRQLNADFNFENLYNYIPYLKKINTPKAAPAANGPKTPRKGRNRKPGLDVDNLPPPPVRDTSGGILLNNKRKKGKDQPPVEYQPGMLERVIIRPLLAFRKAQFNYREQYQSIVPGFTPIVGTLGMNSLTAPGWDYTLGYRQPNDNWLNDAGARGWISGDIRQNRPVSVTYAQSIDGRVSLEPFPDFIVDLNIKKDYTRTNTQEFRDTTEFGTGPLVHSNYIEYGSYQTSFIALNTLFRNSDDVFKDFDRNRQRVSNILGANQPFNDSIPGYRVGYGPTQQDVRINAFVKTYAGKDISTSTKNFTGSNSMPQLNWQLRYAGLTKLPFFKEYFQSINITHGYRSTLTVNSYHSNDDYDPVNNTRDSTKGNFYTAYGIPQVVITEQFSPLLGIDARLKNDFSFRMEYKKARNLALGDQQINETKTSELTVGLGKKWKNVIIPFLLPPQPKKPRRKKTDPVPDPGAANGVNKGGFKGNDLELKFDMSFRDDKTDIRDLIGQDRPSRGAQTLRFSPSLKYTLNKALDVRAFFDFDKLVPYTTATFPTVAAKGGFVVTFKLQ